MSIKQVGTGKVHRHPSGKKTKGRHQNEQSFDVLGECLVGMRDEEYASRHYRSLCQSFPRIYSVKGRSLPQCRPHFSSEDEGCYTSKEFL